MADLTGKSSPVGVAMIGAGMVAATHMNAIRDASGQVILRGVMARSKQSAESLLARFEWAGLPSGRPKVYDGLSDIVADPLVDAVIIVTPPNARADLIAPLAKAGKHILLEKPVARTAQEAETIVSICRDAGVTLGIVLQHRMREASLAAKRLIEQQGLGRLGLVEIAVPWWREQGYYNEPGRGSYARDGGGVLISQAIHTIDLALSLAGPVARVQAMTGTTCFHDMEAEDFATAGLWFRSGAVGSLVASTAAFPGAAESIHLHFEKASLKLQSGVLQVLWRDGRTEVFGEVAGTGGGADPMAFTHAWHQAILTDFVAALAEARSPVASGQAVLGVHHLITAIENSARKGQIMEVQQ